MVRERSSVPETCEHHDHNSSLAIRPKVETSRYVESDDLSPQQFVFSSTYKQAANNGSTSSIGIRQQFQLPTHISTLAKREPCSQKSDRLTKEPLPGLKPKRFLSYFHQDIESWNSPG